MMVQCMGYFFLLETTDCVCNGEQILVSGKVNLLPAHEQEKEEIMGNRTITGAEAARQLLEQFGYEKPEAIKLVNDFSDCGRTQKPYGERKMYGSWRLGSIRVMD